MATMKSRSSLLHLPPGVVALRDIVHPGNNRSGSRCWSRRRGGKTRLPDYLGAFSWRRSRRGGGLRELSTRCSLGHVDVIARIDTFVGEIRDRYPSLALVALCPVNVDDHVTLGIQCGLSL